MSRQNKLHDIKGTLGFGFGLSCIYVLLLALLFFTFILGSSVIRVMDAGGWLFFMCSCVSHAASIILILFLLVYTPLDLLLSRRTASVVFLIFTSFLFMLVFLDKQVYALYRFHINGFVLNMVFGEGVTEIFEFDAWLLVKEFAILFLFPVILTVAAVAWHYIALRGNHRVYIWCMFSLMCVTSLYAHLSHIYTSYIQKPSVLQSQRLLPYYFPTQDDSLMRKMHIKRAETISVSGLSDAGDVVYPKKPIEAQPLQQKPNILLILIDSWNKRTLTEECMPYLSALSQRAWNFDNHFSGSNGTRSAVFGLYFSVPGYYIDMFTGAGLSPVFIDELLRQGYFCQMYPSATLISPPFHTMLFQHIHDLNTHTEGDNSYERDIRLTDDFLDYVSVCDTAQPFFAMLFYDMAHSFTIPKDENNYFTPAWDYADYTRLNNTMDPLPFFNLYRNCCHVVDREIGRVLEALEQKGIADNTIIVVTGDHAQEFNENGHNYWGHNGNFSRWQIGVPLIVRFPRTSPAYFTHRTTHYDIVPTLMQEALGVTNVVSDYSCGRLLTDTTPRQCQVVGSELNYAFIIEGDTILEKTPEGTLEAFDAQMNPLINYHINRRTFEQMMEQLNMFVKIATDE